MSLCSRPPPPPTHITSHLSHFFPLFQNPTSPSSTLTLLGFNLYCIPLVCTSRLGFYGRTHTLFPPLHPPNTLHITLTTFFPHFRTVSVSLPHPHTPRIQPVMHPTSVYIMAQFLQEDRPHFHPTLTPLNTHHTYHILDGFR